MRRWYVIAALAIAVAAVVAVGAALAVTPPVVERAGETIPSAIAPVPATPDTPAGVDDRLKRDFAIQTVPSDAATVVSEDQAMSTAVSKWEGYAKTAKTTTVRHVTFTNSGFAALTDDQLAGMGISERPQDLDTWMVTFHKVALHMHGPRAQSRSGSLDNFVVFISTATGEQIQACGFGPVE
ncbi:MAG: hypothetical protein Q7V53_03355 [Caldisericota bacterium]|nr:hypothetical protein [Caldisericota bacterium]